jgi:dihydrofolate reductase
VGLNNGRHHETETIMRKIIVSANLSLDGVMAHPERWSMQYWSAEHETAAAEQLSTAGSLLMGRHTYDGFAKAWPTMESIEGEFAVRMNTMPKYVVSTTLQKADWNNTTILRDIADVAALKEQPGGDLLMYGYGPVAQALLERGLLDEVRFWLTPVFVGSTDPDDLIARPGRTAALELVSTNPLRTGVVILTYRPATAATRSATAATRSATAATA